MYIKKYQSLLVKSMLPLRWFIPFACFLAGYATIDLFLHRSYFPTPAVLSLPLADALTILSHHNLSVRLIDHKEDEQLPEGTVISQNPSAESSIRPQQTVFLVTSCKPTTQATPLFVGKSVEVCKEELKETGLTHALYYVASNHPQGTCVAQLPQAGAPLVGKIILYISHNRDTSRTTLVMLPSLCDKPASEVIAFLHAHQIPFHIFHGYRVAPDHACTDCIIEQQKPCAGSFINLHHPPIIQLKVNR